MANTFIIHDLTSRDRAKRFIFNLNLDKKWEVEIKPHVKKRSLSQNRLMHKWLDEVVKLMSEHTGHDHYDIDLIFKTKFLKPKLTEDFDGHMIKSWSTKNLDTKPMSEYLEEIYAFCTTDFGLFLTVPELRGYESSPNETENGE